MFWRVNYMNAWMTFKIFSFTSHSTNKRMTRFLDKIIKQILLNFCGWECPWNQPRMFWYSHAEWLNSTNWCAQMMNKPNDLVDCLLVCMFAFDHSNVWMRNWTKSLASHHQLNRSKLFALTLNLDYVPLIETTIVNECSGLISRAPNMIVGLFHSGSVEFFLLCMSNWIEWIFCSSTAN